MAECTSDNGVNLGYPRRTATRVHAPDGRGACGGPLVRITFEEAMTVFADPLAQIFDDPDHSLSEKREIIVGNSGASHLLVVGFTDRQGTVRIINARAATARERRHYEKDSQTSKGR